MAGSDSASADHSSIPEVFCACSRGGCLLGAAPAKVAGSPDSSDVPGMDLFTQMSLAWALSHSGLNLLPSLLLPCDNRFLYWLFFSFLWQNTQKNQVEEGTLYCSSQFEDLVHCGDGVRKYCEQASPR